MAILRPCRNTAAFEVVPERELRLDLTVVESALAAAGYERVVRAGVMLIMRPRAASRGDASAPSGTSSEQTMLMARKEPEVSVYRSGKMLLKTRDPDRARALAAVLVPLVLPADEQGMLRAEGLERMARATGGA